MFSGNFLENFGIPQFQQQQSVPFAGIDPQGGMFGPTAPQSPLIGSQPMGIPGAEQQPSPASGVGGASPSPTAPSPLASPLAAGQNPAGAPQPQQPDQAAAPAAGVGSPFGRPAQ